MYITNFIFYVFLYCYSLNRKGKPCERILMDDPSYLPHQVPPAPSLPVNVMIINSVYDSNQCLRRLLRIISESG